METTEYRAQGLMRSALNHLREGAKTRENSLTITKLEEAIMWNSRDQSMKYSTPVEENSVVNPEDMSVANESTE